MTRLAGFALGLLAAAASADDLLPVADSYVQAGQPAVNFGADPNLFLSSNYVGGSVPRDHHRAYLLFDLSGYPAGTRIALAEVWWYQYGGGGAGCLPADAHRVTGAWSEGTLTWANRPTHDGTSLSSVCVGDNFSPGWKAWRITGLVQGWLDGSFPNQGVVIKDQYEIQAGASRLGRGYSREAPDPTRWPFLRIKFATLTTTSTPQVGTTVTLALYAPGDPGNGYVAGSAFGSVPGIPVDTRVIPLNVDPLLLISLTTPSLFEAYAGVLDGSGRATARIHLPAAPALAGLTFYSSFITLRPGAPSGIGAIADALGLTVVP